MADMKNVRRSRRGAPTVDRWLLDVDDEERRELEIDPYAGRFPGDHPDYDLEDSELDRLGGHGLFGF